jgi:hypothetical protein
VRVGYEVIVRQRLVIICKWKLGDLKEMKGGGLAGWEGLGAVGGGAGIGERLPTFGAYSDVMSKSAIWHEPGF